ncbi:MAG: hypothetical protein ACOCYP_00940 [Planctomycetota bacterium]
MLARWVAAGLPQREDGSFCQLTVANWVAWHRLDEAPVLARAWRSYLDHFRPFVIRTQQPRPVRWHDTRRFFLPAGVAQLEWELPLPCATASQQVRQEGSFGGRALEGGGEHGVIDAPESAPALRATSRLVLRPLRCAVPGELRRCFAELASDWIYVYQDRRVPEMDATGHRGDCLAAALTLGEQMAALGRKWRLLAGVIARDDLINPHYWIEVADTDGWIPFDPTLPAIARMLGEDPQAWIAAYAGGCDAGRVAVACGAACAVYPHRAPGRLSLSGPGIGTGVDGWACIDWVCGSCTGSFAPDAV